MKVRRRKHISGEVMICFNDQNIAPIHLIDDQVVNVAERGVSVHAIQRSNIRTLIGQGFLEVVA
jgi:hypothetical protein